MKNKELSFDSFRKLAKSKGLSDNEKIGFPDSYRSGYEEKILKDIYDKLQLQNRKGLKVLDIGCGASELTRKLASDCLAMKHKLVLLDSKEMLKNLKLSKEVEMYAGKFPDKKFTEKHQAHFDCILCYSVLFYVFANDNVFDFIHQALDVLKPGGRLLLGDIPNVDKRDRFLNSEDGKKFLKKGKQLKGSTAHENRSQKMDDSVVMAILNRYRSHGMETYLLPQNDDLPMANRREDILIIKR